MAVIKADAYGHGDKEVAISLYGMKQTIHIHYYSNDYWRKR